MNATVLFATGTPAVATVCRDSHTGAPYVYARNVNGVTVRVYLTPGESCEWVEVATPHGRSALDYTPDTSALAA